MITGFNHLSFTVADIDRSVRFWTDHLGFAAASVSPREGQWQEQVTGVPGASLMVAHLFGHGQHVEFVQYRTGAVQTAAPSPAAATSAHVCLEVDDIVSTWNDLISGGASPQGEITAVESAPAKRCKAGYLRDPNGIIIELLELMA
jgi:catechol 2,3-dioxygenase-like lactoylglutathione lyase family enzyme